LLCYVLENSLIVKPTHVLKILLVIEVVADTSLNYDLNVKIPLYAQYQIPESWLLDCNADRLEIFKEAQNNDYRWHLKPHLNEIVTLFAQSDIKIDLGKIFTEF